MNPETQTSVWRPPVYPLRRVVETSDYTNKYCRPGEGRREHHLECGHVVLCKQSCGYSKRKRCRDCPPNAEV